MTHVILGDCATTGYTGVELYSTLIDDYIAGLPTPDHTLDLEIKVDGGTASTISITAANPNLDTINGEYTITPSDISETASFGDHILDLTLVKTLTADSSKTYEYRCLFLDCETRCDLIDYIANNPNDCKVYALYLALQDLNVCSQCSCDNGVDIFNYLKGLIDGTSVNTSDCGCS